jgi:hypothetical protein
MLFVLELRSVAACKLNVLVIVMQEALPELKYECVLSLDPDPPIVTVKVLVADVFSVL